MSKVNELFGQPIKAINLGLPSFADDLKKQGVPVVHVDWRPAAGGNPRMLELLEKIKKSQGWV